MNFEEMNADEITISQLQKAIANSNWNSLPLAVTPIHSLTKLNLLKTGAYKLSDVTTESLVNAGIVRNSTVNELKADLVRILNNEYYYDNLKELLTSRLNTRELEIIHGRYGLVSNKATLEELGAKLDVTRERVRQIEVRAIDKISSGVWQLQPEVHREIRSLADDLASPDMLEEYSDFYKGDGLLMLINDIYGGVFRAYKPKRLNLKVLIRSEKIGKLEKTIDSAIELLMIQKNYVPITAVAKETKLDVRLLNSLKDSNIIDKHIALNSNRVATGNVGLIERTLEEEKGPLTINEMAIRSGLSKGQVRGCLNNYDRFVNIGQSKYALTEWGYIGGSTSDVIAHYLEKSSEPMSTREIKKLVHKQKDVTDGTITATLAGKRFKRVGRGLYTLSNRDEFEEVSFSVGSYKISADETVTSVLKDKGSLMQAADIISAINNKYGDDASSNPSTVRASLMSLAENGEIVKTKKGRAAYYYFPGE